MSTELGAALSEFLRGAWRKEPPTLEASLAMLDEVREPLRGWRPWLVASP